MGAHKKNKENKTDRARREKLKQAQNDAGKSKRFNKSRDHVKKGLDSDGRRK